MARLARTTSLTYWIGSATLLLVAAGLFGGGWWALTSTASPQDQEGPATTRKGPTWQPYAMDEALDDDSPTASKTRATSEPPERRSPDETTSPPPSRLRPGQQQRGRSSGSQQRDLQPAVLRVVTNFEKADVSVNGLPYPEYVEDDDEEPGMVLPAGGPYTVRVNYNGKTKVYTISLRPYRTRILMVELSGFEGGSITASAGSDEGGGNSNANEADGRVTVYSKPKGSIVVDGEGRDQQTPGTVQVPAGRHDIQVRFDGDTLSESKTVRVRKGSRIKLFFRKNN